MKNLKLSIKEKAFFHREVIKKIFLYKNNKDNNQSMRYAEMYYTLGEHITEQYGQRIIDIWDIFLSDINMNTSIFQMWLEYIWVSLQAEETSVYADITMNKLLGNINFDTKNNFINFLQGEFY